MIIEAQDSFKNWLSAVLKPMCEADPAALAKYVIALIKKDKSEEELRKTMKEQLLVFLEEETESFVQQVFETLKTKEYITTPVIPNANPPNPNSVKPLKEVNKPPTDPVSDPDSINGSKKDGDLKREFDVKVDVRKELDLRRELELKGDRRELELKGDARRELDLKGEVRRERDLRKDEREERNRRRHRSLSRNRSRSRSWERGKRSRSKERDRERGEKRERNRPSWRNKSPVTGRRYDRRRSRTPSPPGRMRSRSRSPRHMHRLRYRNRTPMRSTSRSRSRSPLGDKLRERRDSLKERDSKESLSCPGTPTADGVSGEDTRVSTGPAGQPAQPLKQPPPSAGSVAPPVRRCRDYDERGYCMRGEMCPFDHGVDPVVLEDSALTRVLAYNPNGGENMGGPPAVPAPGHPLLLGPRPPGPFPPEYNPQAPQMWGHRGGYRGGRMSMGMTRLPQMNLFPPPQQPNIQRELIPVPVLDNKKGGEYPPGVPPNHRPFLPHLDGPAPPELMPYKKRPFDFTRLGPRAKNPINCSLELKKVPPGLNTITHLNNHFAKFGRIVNIQVNYEGDPEAALITFSSHAEANAAYRSTEAVLNNRFIKVFWHNNMEGKSDNTQPSQLRSVKDRLGKTGPVQPINNKSLNLVQSQADTTQTTEPTDDSNTQPEKIPISREEQKSQEVAAVKKSQELLAVKDKVKKNQEEKKKEVLKMSQNLRKRKQELLEKQIGQQKILIEKMEKAPAGPQRDALKDTIKKIQESIEGIKKDLEKATTAAAVASKATNKRKSKEETQKEMLDIELDLISKQQEGVDTTELQRKIIELKVKAGTVLSRGRGRGRKYLPVRHLLSKNNLIDIGSKATSLIKQKKAAQYQKHIVDHRPTSLLISGYETDEQKAVVTFFKQFGEIVNQHIDSSIPSVIFTYKTRKEAEMALLKGKHFQDRTLSVTWCNNVPSVISSTGNLNSSTRSVRASESEEEQLIGQGLLEGDDELGTEVSEETLLHDDEEDDDESEDRSWRR